MVYDRQDDSKFTELLISRRIPLFSLDILVGPRGYVLENISGGPKANTIEYMQKAGERAIERSVSRGKNPRAVRVTHDVYGNLRTRCSYK